MKCLNRTTCTLIYNVCFCSGARNVIVDTPTKVPEQHPKAIVLFPAAATARSSVAGACETVCMCMVNDHGNRYTEKKKIMSKCEINE